MRPWAPFEVLPPRQGDVHAIERSQKLVGAPQLLEYFNDLWLKASLPGKFLMRRPVGVVHAAEPSQNSGQEPRGSTCQVRSPSFKAHGEMIGVPGALIIFIKSQLELFQPFDLLLGVICSLFLADDIFDQDTTQFVKLVAPISIVRLLKREETLGGFELLRTRFRRSNDSFSGRHRCSGVQGIMDRRRPELHVALLLTKDILYIMCVEQTQGCTVCLDRTTSSLKY